VPLIEVMPEQLLTAGSRQATMAAELRAVRSRLQSAGASATSGAGEASAAATMADCCQAWSDSMAALAEAVDGYGANLTAAGSAYTGTDTSAIPAPAAGG